MRQRALSLCIALTLCLSLLPTPALAAGAEDISADATQVIEESENNGQVLSEVENTPEKSEIPVDFDGDDEAIAELAAASDDWSYTVSNGVATISKYNGTTSKVTVPTSAVIDGSSYRLRTIDASAFSGNQYIKEVVISEGITSIGDNAFNGCIALRSVTIPESATKLGNGAFKNCTNLASVTINGDLSDCSEYSTWNGNYKNGGYRYSRDYSVFYNAGTNVDAFSVTFGSTVTRIPAYLFATFGSKSDNVYAHITSVTISDSVKEIGAYAFYNCYDLEKVSMGKGLISTDSYAFAHASTLKSITLGTNMDSLGQGTFEGCTNLSDVTLNSKLKTIYSYAFENCYALGTIVVPQSVVKLSNGVFKNCTNLNSVTINGDLSDCSEYSTWNGNYKNGDYRYSRDYSVFYNAGTNVDAFSVTFGSSVTRIPAYLFATFGSKSDNVYAHITSVTISDSVKEIGAYAFYNCYDLEKVGMGKGLISTDSYAFAHASALKSVTLGASMDSLGQGTFEGCTNLSNVTLNDKLTTIYSYAFENCYALGAIVVPQSVVKLSNGVFKNCTNLVSVTINGNLSDCSEYSTWNGNYKNGDYRYSRDYSVFYNTGTNADAFSVVFGSSVTRIPAYLFATFGNKSDNVYAHITSVTIPDCVKEIGAYAFYNCYDLTDVYYSGSKEDLQKAVTIDDGNDNLTGGAFKKPVSSPVPVESVSLNKTELSLDVGTSETLKATVLPDNATNKSVKWTSSKESVATVSSSGEVTAKVVGETTITVTTNDGGKTATCVVKVTDPTPVIPVESVSLNKNELSLNVGKTERLTATVLPSNATNKSVKWTSNNKSVATVSSLGRVTAKSAGQATITVTTVDGSKTATCAVTVTVPVESVSLNKTELSLDVGKSETLKATVLPDNATNKSVKWTSSNRTVATVSSAGKVTRKANGEATITVTTVDGGKTATCTLTNTPEPDTPQILIENATASKGSTVDIPVKITNNPGIAGATLTVSYDKSALTLNGSTKGPVFEKGSFTDYPETGVVQWYHTADITDDGVLFTLQFSVNQNATDKDYDISIGLRDNLPANLSKADASNASVQFKSGVLQVKSGILGDVTGDGVVAINDVVKLARAVAGNITLTAEEQKLGDVTGDGVIAINDVVKLARYVAGNIASLQSTGATLLSASEAAVIKTATVKASPGETVQVPVSISNNSGIAGAQLDISFQEEGLTLKNIIKGNVLAAGTFNPDVQNGKVQWYHTSNVTENGVLFTLEFEVSANAKDGEEYAVEVGVTDGIAANLCDADFESVAVDFTDGMVQIGEPSQDTVISAVSKNGTTVTADIVCSDTSATAFCGIYNNNGQFVTAGSHEISGATTYNFQFDGYQFDYAKVFVFDSDCRPLCESKKS